MGVIEMRRLMEVHGFSLAKAQPADAAAHTESVLDTRPQTLRQTARPQIAGDSSPSQHAQLESLLRIHEYERERLGQELHDSAGQLVVALQLSVAHLKRLGGDREYRDLIDEIQDTVRLIDREIRSVAYLHHNAELDRESLPQTMQMLAWGFGRRTGIRTTFKSVGDNSLIDRTVSTSLLRVTQEALVNVYRHAHASTVKVVLERRPELFRLTITDDGVGFTPDSMVGPAAGIGLQGMRHRVEMVGGRFGAKNLKRGVRVWANVPVSMPG